MFRVLTVAAAAIFLSGCVADYMAKVADMDEAAVAKIEQGLDLYCNKIPKNKRMALRKHFHGRIVVNCD